MSVVTNLSERMSHRQTAESDTHVDQAETYFHKAAEVNEEIPTEQIVPVILIPDYREHTTSPHPIIVRTADTYHCIDGWNKVTGAREAQQQTIMCRVIYARESSSIDLAIRKVAVRTKTQGGDAKHAELVANTKHLRDIIMRSDGDLFMFTHGGARAAGQSEGDRETDAITVLVDRLGKGRNTVLKYLNHAEYLNDSLLTMLIEGNAPKRFFEEAGPHKSRIVSILQEKSIPPDDIQVEVSGAMQQMWEAYEREKVTGIKRIADEITTRLALDGREATTETTSGNAPDDPQTNSEVNDERDSGDRTDHNPPINPGPIESPEGAVSFEEIKTESESFLAGTVTRIREATDPRALDALWESIRGEAVTIRTKLQEIIAPSHA